MKQLTLLVVSLLYSYSFGQQSVNSSGGDVISSAQGTVSFSVGQIATNYIETGASINEGVQQPYEFFSVLSIDQPGEKTLLGVFPNPTEGIIYLKSEDVINATIEMYDESGRLVLNEEKQVIQNSQLDLTAFARGVYTIKVSSDASVQTIKIIKN